jgi:hypothetical protein
MVPPQPPAGFVKTLFGLHDIAEGAPRCSPRLLFSQTESSLAFELKLQVGVNLLAKVIHFAFSSEHSR